MAVISRPKGAEVVVITERYPASGPIGYTGMATADVGSGAPTSAAVTWKSVTEHEVLQISGFL